MCIAIPLGRRDGPGRGPLARLLEPPWRLTLAAALVNVLLLAALAWRGLPVLNAVLASILAGGAALGPAVLAVAVDRAPVLSSSGGEGRVYVVGQALLTLCGMALALAGALLSGPVLAAGLAALAAGWMAAARSVGWQLRWARVPVPMPSRALPGLARGGAGALVTAAIGAAFGIAGLLALAAPLVPLLAAASGLALWPLVHVGNRTGRGRAAHA